jgi:hypothetical protein
MNSRKAAVCSAVCLAGVAGSGLASTVIFNRMEITSVLVIGLVLMISAICVAVYLFSTEKDRQKPWAKDFIDIKIMSAGWSESEIVDAKAVRFGIASGALWILVIAVIITLIFVFEWQYFWLVFLFAIPVQVLLVSTMFSGSAERNSL